MSDASRLDVFIFSGVCLVSLVDRLAEVMSLIEISRNACEANEFRFDLRRPCDDCPFKKGAPMHDGVVKKIPYYDKGLKSGLLGHTCHKTDGRADGPVKGQPNDVVQHCAGAAIFQMKCNGNKFPKLIIEALENGLMNPDELLQMAINDEEVFNSLDELIDHYGVRIEELIGEKEDVKVCK